MLKTPGKIIEKIIREAFRNIFKGLKINKKTKLKNKKGNGMKVYVISEKYYEYI